MSAIQFQRQLGLSRYETALGILHKLRAGMVRPERDKIGGKPQEHVEVDETWVGGRTRGEGRGVHHKVLVSCAVEVRHRKPGTRLDDRKDGRYAGRVRLAVVPDRSAKSLCGFVENAVAPGSLIVTDDWRGYAGLRKRGFDHHAFAEWEVPEIAEEFLPIIHLVFANLKTWINGVHHGVSAKHLQAYLNEFTFRFNRRGLAPNIRRSKSSSWTMLTRPATPSGDSQPEELAERTSRTSLIGPQKFHIPLAKPEDGVRSQSAPR